MSLLRRGQDDEDEGAWDPNIPPHAFVAPATRSERIALFFEQRVTAGRLIAAAGALFILASLLVAVVTPAPYSWWPRLPASWLPWGDLSAANRLALGAVIFSATGLIGLLLSLAAALIQLRAFVPSQQKLQFMGEQLPSEPRGRRWRVRISNEGALIQGYRIEVVVLPAPAAVESPDGWAYVSAFDSGHGGDTHYLHSDEVLFPQQSIVGPAVELGAHNHVSYSIRWWTAHSGPHIDTFWAGVDFPEQSPCPECYRIHYEQHVHEAI